MGRKVQNAGFVRYLQATFQFFGSSSYLVSKDLQP